MLKGVNNQSNAYSNKRRSGMRSRATRDAAWNDDERTRIGVESRRRAATERCSDNQVIILGATFIVASS